jgi:hypothetical protein
MNALNSHNLSGARAHDGTDRPPPIQVVRFLAQRLATVRLTASSSTSPALFIGTSDALL